MSEIELLDSLRETVDSGSGHFMNFANGLFAFIAASYFAGAQLSRMNVRILVGIFSAFSLISAASALSAASNAEAIAQAIARLPEHEIAMDTDVRALTLGKWLLGATIGAGYVAGIAFLRECRKREPS